MPDEGREQRFVSPCGTEPLLCGDGQGGDIQSGKICEFDMLEVVPAIFYRIEFRGIRREKEYDKSLTMFFNKLRDRAGPMDIETIPNQDKGAPDIS